MLMCKHLSVAKRCWHEVSVSEGVKLRTYPSGSGWRLWDLHIHHPETLFNNGFRSSTTEERWESYLSAIERWGEIGALGITDYYVY